jgi:hypothetical protein
MTLNSCLNLLTPRLEAISHKPVTLLFIDLQLTAESESGLLYDWRFTANQFVLPTSPFRRTTSNSILQLNTFGYSSYVTSSLTRGWVCRLQLLLVLASAVILRSESRGTRAYFTLSDSRLSQPGGPGARIYIPQEQGGPVILPGTGIPFRRLLRLAASTPVTACSKVGVVI